MGAQGTADLDFGVFPGQSDASVDVTGQAGIISGSLVETWLRPVDSADHTADEHRIETLSVVAGNIVAGTGFTIYGVNSSAINESTTPESPMGHGPSDAQTYDRGGKGTRIWGVWKVAWVWN